MELFLTLRPYLRLLNCIVWNRTSIKRYTCVNKRKNSGSRWMLENNITSGPGGSSQLETRCRSENQIQTEGLWPSVTHGWATQTKMRKMCCYGRGRTWVTITVRFVSTHFSHTTNITLNKVLEIYIFIKKCIRSLPVNDISECKCIFVNVHV